MPFLEKPRPAQQLHRALIAKVDPVGGMGGACGSRVVFSIRSCCEPPLVTLLELAQQCWNLHLAYECARWVCSRSTLNLVLLGVFRYGALETKLMVRRIWHVIPRSMM